MQTVTVQSTTTDLYDEKLRQYMLSVYNYMTYALIVTGLVAFGVSLSPVLMAFLHQTAFKWIVIFAPLAAVFAYSFISTIRESKTASQIFLTIFSALMGLSLSSIFAIYTGMSIASVFFMTAATFAACSLYGYTTKRDLTKLGSFLIMGLFGLIIATIVNIFLQCALLYFVLSYVGVGIFIGLTMYDTQKIKEGSAYMTPIDGAITLYLDFINLFIYMLQIFGNRQ